MTEEEYQKEKDKILSQSKNKGLDQWEKVLAAYGIDVEQAKKGVYIPPMGRYIQLYFDSDKDRWMYKEINPINS